MGPPSDLHMTVAYGDVEDVERLLTQDNVNSECAWDWGSLMDRTPEASTPSFCACYWGRIDILPLLIKAGADVNKPNLEGRTPLHQACVYNGPESKTSEMIRMLVTSGADVNATDHDGFTPLALACQRMSQIHTDEIFKLLVNAGGNVDRITSIRYSAPKTLPFKDCHKYCFPPDEKQQFLSLWDNPKDPTPEPSTPLICACYLGRFDLLQLFIGAGAEVNQSNFDGWTPLHEACDHHGPNVFKMIKILLNNGAIVNITDHRGVTPLHAACVNKSRRRHTIVRMLMKSGAVANYPTPSCRYLANPTTNRNNKYCSQGLLHFAIGNNRTAVKVLIDSGVDINAKCWRGRTPLFFTVQCRDTSSLRILIKAGADLNMASHRGLTPLHEAVRILGDEDEMFEDFGGMRIMTRSLPVLTKCVAFLLESGADLNSVDAEGITPLQYANHTLTHTPVIDNLLEHGAGVNVKCKKLLCLCESTVTTCHYVHNRPLFENVYWTYYSKMTSAGLSLGEGFLPSRIILSWKPDWFFSTSILSILRNQLPDVKNKTVGNTEITFYDVLIQFPSAMKNPLFKEILTRDYCLREFSAYGTLIHARYVRGVKRFDLIERSIPFFSLIQPPLPEESATEVLRYLGEQELLNIIDIIKGSCAYTTSS